MDDLLASMPTEQDALHLIRTAISRLRRYDLNSCKVQSNSSKVRQEYPPKEPLPEIISLKEDTPYNPADESTSLGLQWHIKHDPMAAGHGNLYYLSSIVMADCLSPGPSPWWSLTPWQQATVICISQSYPGPAMAKSSVDKPWQDLHL